MIHFRLFHPRLPTLFGHSKANEASDLIHKLNGMGCFRKKLSIYGRDGKQRRPCSRR